MTTSLLIKTTNHYTTNSQGKHSHFVEKKVNEIIKVSVYFHFIKLFLNKED